jgi:hypothetical protein
MGQAFRRAGTILGGGPAAAAITALLGASAVAVVAITAERALVAELRPLLTLVSGQLRTGQLPAAAVEAHADC